MQTEENKERRRGVIMTALDRQRWIEGLMRGPASRAHIERLKLIYKPFPQVRTIGGGGSAKTWAGTIVTDTFFGTAERPTGKKGDGRELLETGSTYSGKYSDIEVLI